MSRTIPRPGELLHFSEDPGITRFEPHVAATSPEPDAYVWTVDELNSPCYWFPRQCPRVCLWGDPDGDPTARVSAIEPEWVEAMTSTTLYAYSFDAANFEPFGERPHAFVARHEVTALRPAEAVGDLWEAHREAGIELRVVEDLHDFLAAGRERAYEFSAIRMRNSRAGNLN